MKVLSFGPDHPLHYTMKVVSFGPDHPLHYTMKVVSFGPDHLPHTDDYGVKKLDGKEVVCEISKIYSIIYYTHTPSLTGKIPPNLVRQKG